MKKYSIILFDADGTLFDFAQCEREAFREALALSGAIATEDMINDYKEINDSLWKALERKEIEREVLVYKRFEIFADKYNISLDSRKMANDYVECLGKKTYLLDGAEELLQTLYGKVKLYIVTNGIYRVQSSRFAISGLSKYFEEIFISEEIGVNKPDVRFFERATERIADFEKDKAIIIGDSLSSDIAGGIAFGIDTCWFSPEGVKNASVAPTYTVRDLADIPSIIL